MRVVALVVCLAACNQVYGLDPTTARDAFEPIVDDDKDGVADDRDNCVGVANADQSDLDADGKGDGCDTCAFCLPCATGPEHDEDGDRIADGCDNCPAVENADQLNTDGDDLGDLCDPSGAVHRRVFFDGFGSLATDWLPTGSSWNVVDDAVGPTNAQAGATYRLSHASVRIPQGTTWFVEVGIASAPGEGQGVELMTFNLLRCQVVPTSGGYRVDNSGITDTTVFSFPAKARLRYTMSGPLGAQNPDCQLVDVHSREQNIVYNVSYPLSFSLVTMGTGRFTHVDVIGP